MCSKIFHVNSLRLICVSQILYQIFSTIGLFLKDMRTLMNENIYKIEYRVVNSVIEQIYLKLNLYKNFRLIFKG